MNEGSRICVLWFCGLKFNIANALTNKLSEHPGICYACKGPKLPKTSGGSSPTCWVIPLFWEPLLCRNVGVQLWLWENWFHGGSRRIWMGNWRDHPGDEKNRTTAGFSLPKMADNHLKFLNLEILLQRGWYKKIFSGFQDGRCPRHSSVQIKDIRF